MVPLGICPKCGAVYHGWSLIYSPGPNECLYCSTILNVTQDTAYNLGYLWNKKVQSKIGNKKKGGLKPCGK